MLSRAFRHRSGTPRRQVIKRGCSPVAHRPLTESGLLSHTRSTSVIPKDKGGRNCVRPLARGLPHHARSPSLTVSYRGKDSGWGRLVAGPSVDNKVFTLVVVVVCLFFITALTQANGSALEHLPAALAAVAMILRYGGKSQRKKKRKRD